MIAIILQGKDVLQMRNHRNTVGARSTAYSKWRQKDNIVTNSGVQEKKCVIETWAHQGDVEVVRSVLRMTGKGVKVCVVQ